MNALSSRYLVFLLLSAIVYETSRAGDVSMLAMLAVGLVTGIANATGIAVHMISGARAVAMKRIANGCTHLPKWRDHYIVIATMAAALLLFYAGQWELALMSVIDPALHVYNNMRVRKLLEEGGDCEPTGIIDATKIAVEFGIAYGIIVKAAMDGGVNLDGIFTDKTSRQWLTEVADEFIEEHHDDPSNIKSSMIVDLLKARLMAVIDAHNQQVEENLKQKEQTK